MKFGFASLTLRGHIDFWRAFLAVLAVSFVIAGEALAEFRLVPRVTVREEYNDNLYETDLDRKADYITHLQPGIALGYLAPLWDWDISYALDYRHYANGHHSDEETHNFVGNGKIRLIENLLFLDLNDTYSRVSLDVSKNMTSDSLLVNQTDQNIFTVSPYIALQPSPAFSIKTGYIFTDNWYKEPVANPRRRHSAFFDASYEMTSKFFLNSGYRMDRELSSDYSFYRHELFVGPRYEYAEKSFLSVLGGATRSEYDGEGKVFIRPFWNMRLTHSFDTVTASVSSSVRYTDDPLGGAVKEITYGSVNLQKSFSKGNASINSSYSELFDVERNVHTTNRLIAGLNGSYEIFEHLSAKLGFSFEHYRYLDQHGTTRRYYVDGGIGYSFPNNLSLAMNYRYTNYESAEIATDNMVANRVFIEITKYFNQQ